MTAGRMMTGIELTTRDRDREDREAMAVDHLARVVGHDEACAFTARATTPEIAVHLALVVQAAGALASCGADYELFVDDDELEEPEVPSGGPDD
jgi:hypothetical protein